MSVLTPKTLAVVAALTLIGGTAVVANDGGAGTTEIEPTPSPTPELSPSPEVSPTPDATPTPEVEESAKPTNVPQGNAYGWRRNHGDMNWEKPGNGPKPKNHSSVDDGSDDSDQ